MTYVVQLGWKLKLDDVQGRYHIFAWHLDETDETAEANGFALNLEQGFGNWTPFATPMGIRIEMTPRTP